MLAAYMADTSVQAALTPLMPAEGSQQMCAASLPREQPIVLGTRLLVVVQ
jgi:hypothetical protein